MINKLLSPEPLQNNLRTNALLKKELQNPKLQTNAALSNQNELALYIHVPFCRRKCRYCDFYSVAMADGAATVTDTTAAGDTIAAGAVAAADGAALKAYAAALCREIAYYGAQPALNGRRVGTLFFGGGTPSLLPTVLIKQILAEVRRWFELTPTAEITLEANPGTVDAAYLQELRQLCVNRLSLGLQSLNDAELALLGRIHRADDCYKVFNEARRAGFANISVDLIFGLPRQTPEAWEESLDQVWQLVPEHISAYNLQLEEGTELLRQVTAGELPQPDEEAALHMFRRTIKLCRERGYEHYEISNFARAGYQARHNLVYWHDQEYLGLGPGAHSFLQHERWANRADVQRYCRCLSAGNLSAAQLSSADSNAAVIQTSGSDAAYLNTVDLNFVDLNTTGLNAGGLKGAAAKPVAGKETAAAVQPCAVLLDYQEQLTKRTEISEYLIMGLRLRAGINLTEFQRRFGCDLRLLYERQICDLQRENMIILTNDCLKLSEKGLIFANRVFLEFV